MKLPVPAGFDPAAFIKYFKNTGWLMLARIGSLILKMLTGIAIANYLGSTGNGILAYPMAIITFFLAASALGLDVYLTRELLARPQDKKALMGSAFVLRIIAGLGVLPLIYATYFLIQHYSSSQPDVSFSYLLIVSLVCLFQATNVIDSFFQAQAQGVKIMLAQISANLLSALFKILLILFKAQLIYFFWALLADAVLLSAMYLLVYRGAGEQFRAWRFNPALALSLLKKSWPLAFSAVLVSLYMKIDQVMIHSFLDSRALGIYATVTSLSESWYFIPMATVSALFPAIMNARREDPQRYHRRLQNLYDLMSLLSLSIALLMSLASPYVFRLLYTAEYAYGAEILSIHIWAGVFVFLGAASGQYLIAEGFLQFSLLRTALGALVNILLNLWWIPLYGIKGAAYGTLVAYACTTLVVLFYPKTRQQGWMMLASLIQLSLLKRLWGRLGR